MNGTCAGGTGAFIDQMASLLHTDAAGLNELAKGATQIHPIASRCGVFAKSDVQPLLNEGAKPADIAASIFQAVANQTVSGLACGHPIRGYVAFLGGPLQYLSELRHRFYLTLNLDDEHIIVPENAHLFVATGAALAGESEKYVTFDEVIQLLENLHDVQGSEWRAWSRSLSPRRTTRSSRSATTSRWSPRATWPPTGAASSSASTPAPPR